MHRRHVLSLLGSGIAGLAGCSFGGRVGNTGSQSGTRDTRTPPETPLSVEPDGLQPAVVGLNVDNYGLVAEPRTQYLFLAVAGEAGPSPSRSDFRFRFDGESFAPLEPAESPSVHRPDAAGSPYDNGSGWLLFLLPETGDASDAALGWPGGAWRPDEAHRVRLAAPMPALTLTEWTVPDTVAVGDESGFGLTVVNQGDVSGRFVGAINAEGWSPHRPVAITSHRVPANESVSWEVPGEAITLVDERLEEAVGDGEADVTYTLVWPGDARERQVRVVPEG